MQIENAKIGTTFLGIEDHGLLSSFLHLEGAGWGQGFGGLRLDAKDWMNAPSFCGAYIRAILGTLEVDRWENLPGTLLRIRRPDTGGSIRAIGHIVKDQWFDPSMLTSMGHRHWLFERELPDMKEAAHG